MAFLDGLLTIGTAVDNSGFEKGTSNLKSIANTAFGQLTADVVQKVSSAAAQIPQQMINVGSGFEASMSQVAATMGITSAAAEFQTLSAAAKEMGETTKFSASQAGEALNYLALAGYDANKAVAALPTVLNVAAAGGMELASASDMITDAMSALGLETSQMSTFADQLAVTAQKSNTSVSQLGEAILTVGGTAKMLSGGVTEMNTALGVLADNGIKGSEGGTALRNVILSLSAPTDTAAAALNSLGVTAFDASGAMRPLEDTFADLNTALSSLSDQERTAVLNEIFNKVDLKSVNALLGTSSERFDELSGYISDCAGAAAQMAATMDDNLKGDFTIMQSALEGLGIAAYEKFQVPFRDAVQEVTEHIGGLTENLTDGKLSGSMDKVANGLSDVAESAISLASEQVLPAVIDSLAWIVDNGNTLVPIITTAGAAVISYKAAVHGAAAAQKLFNAELALNPYALVASGVIVLTSGLINLAGASKRAAQELKDSARDSLADYENQKNKVEDINTELDNINTTIEEIQSKGTLTFTDEQELENLKSQSAELSAQLEIERELLRLKSKKSADDAYKAIMSDDGGIDTVHEKLENYKAALTEANNNIKYWEEELDKALKKGDIKTAEKTQETIDYYNNRMSDSKEAILEELFSMSEFAEDLDLTSEKGKEAKEAFEQLKKEVFDYFNIAGENNPASDVYNSTASAINTMGRRMAAEYTDAYEKAQQAISDGEADLLDQQETSSANLEAAWKQLEHAYATGAIATEAELYRQKSALLEQYGNADLEDHWKYYEDLYAYQKESAKNSIRLAEEAAREQADIRDQEWNNIAHRQSLGLLSAEDAYRQQLAFIKKYCPEYSDERYNYYQTVLEYQRDAQQKQVDSVKDGISELVAEYKSAFKELESERNSYKNRLMSVGSLFSVDTETDENGNTSKIVSVENMRKQMAEMQKYHDYITKLKSQGATDGFIGEMASMDFKDGLFTAKNLAEMSESEFKEINELYRQKEELADKLSGELFEPELNELNEGLVNGVLDKFGTLPPEIQEIGAESLAAFIAGLTGGDLSEQVDEFAEKFASDCAEGIQNSFAGTELDFAALMNADAYSIGKNAGDEYVEGFNEALAQIQTAVAAEQNFSAASTAPKRYSETVPQTSAESSARGASSDRIVIQNHIEVDMDGEKVAEKVIEKEEIINYRKGE